MTKYKTQPPWEFLLTASRNTLQSYELSRLGHASNLRKEIGELLDQWLDENASAMVARWLIKQRAQATENSAEETGETRDESASDNFLVDRMGAPPAARGRS